MTIETTTPLAQHTVAGIGPYAISYPYAEGSLIVTIELDGESTVIAPAALTIDPAESATTGTLYLDLDVATANAGGRILIERVTPDEQGWVGVLGERERGLEAQLDRATMSIQELRAGLAGAVRVRGTQDPLVAEPGALLIWDENGQIANGPDASDIAAAQANAEAATAAALAAALSAAQAALFDGYWIDTHAALDADTVLTYSAGPGQVAAGDHVQVRESSALFRVAASGATDHDHVTAGGVKLYAAGFFYTPRMFGAAGDNATDDQVAIQACMEKAAADRKWMRMEGLSYRCAGELYTDSYLSLDGEGATIYFTAFGTTGGHFTNVWPTSNPGGRARRVQTNVVVMNLTLDGSLLPTTLVDGRPVYATGENTNLMGFAWGAQDFRIIDCTFQNVLHGRGGTATGGAGYGDEQGTVRVTYVRPRAIDCYRGARFSGLDGTNEDVDTVTPIWDRATFGSRVIDPYFERCGCAVYAHALDADDTAATWDATDLARMSVFITGGVARNCGHYPWFNIDYATYPAISPQKAGVFVFAGATGVVISGMQVTFDDAFYDVADAFGRSGYPASGNYIGAGLTGNVGALVWGWGRDIHITDIIVSGTVNALFNFARAVTFGDLGSAVPTGIANELKGILLRGIKQVRGSCQHVFDCMSGVNNADMGIVIEGVTLQANPTVSIVGTNAAALTSVTLEFRSRAGTINRGRAAEFSGTSITAPADFAVRGTFAAGGGYDAAGARNGMTWSADVLRLSTVENVSTTDLEAFYSPSGLAGRIRVTGAATAYATTSDGRLKENLAPFDALAEVLAWQMWRYAWKETGHTGYGPIAQDLHQVAPWAVTPGGEDPKTDPWDYDPSKLVPHLVRAVQQLHDRLAALEVAEALS